MSEIDPGFLMSVSMSLNDISTNTDAIAAVLSGIAEAINKLTEAVENKGK